MAGLAEIPEQLGASRASTSVLGPVLENALGMLSPKNVAWGGMAKVSGLSHAGRSLLLMATAADDLACGGLIVSEEVAYGSSNLTLMTFYVIQIIKYFGQLPMLDNMHP